MTTTLFNKYLCERDFGSTVFHVKTFQKWVTDKGLHLRTVPELSEYEFAQVESLLCAIERGAAPQTTDDARAIIDSKPDLAGHEVAVRFPEPDHSHVWLVGADAHFQWRKMIERAIDANELQLLDGASYLPVSNRPPISSASVKAEPKDWIEKVREIGLEYIARHKPADLFPPQRDVCLYIEKIAREQKIYGPHGRPLSQNYIQRNAIQGDWWKQNKP